MAKYPALCGLAPTKGVTLDDQGDLSKHVDSIEDRLDDLEARLDNVDAEAVGEIDVCRSPQLRGVF